MWADGRRQVSVYLAKAAGDLVDRVHGRFIGLASADIPLIDDALRVVEQAIQLGMFAPGEPGGVTLRLAGEGPSTRNFTFEAEAQHVSLLRVIGNVLRARLESTHGTAVGLHVVGSYGAGGSVLAPLEAPTMDTIAYLSGRHLVSFDIDMEELTPPCDCVVRIQFTQALSEQAFHACEAICLIWDQLLASNAYMEPDDIEWPSLQGDSELYMSSPTMIEHLVPRLRQSGDCFLGLYLALDRSPSLRACIRLVEVSRLL